MEGDGTRLEVYGHGYAPGGREVYGSGDGSGYLWVYGSGGGGAYRQVYMDTGGGADVKNAGKWRGKGVGWVRFVQRYIL